MLLGLGVVIEGNLSRGVGLAGRSLLRFDQPARRCVARGQVEARARRQHVQLQPQHADGLPVADGVDGRIAGLGGIDDGGAAAALHFDAVVGRDEGRGVLVKADADREWVVGERGQQAAEAIALAEMLVDDEAVGRARARAPGARCRRSWRRLRRRPRSCARTGCSRRRWCRPPSPRARWRRGSAWPRGCRRAGWSGAAGCRR